MPSTFETIDALDKAARVAIGPVRKLFQAAARALRVGITDAQISDAIQTTDAAPMLSGPAWDELEDRLRDAVAADGPLAKAMSKAAKMTAAEAPLKGLAIDLDAIDAVAIEFLDNHGADLVVDVTESTRGGIRQVVTDATRGPSTNQKAARAILADVKGFGLTAREAKHFDTWAADLFARAADPKSSLFDLTEKQLQRKLEVEYNRRLVNRAKRIANTEAYEAANFPRRATWTQAVTDGELDADEYLLQWVTRVVGACPRCQALDGKTAEIVDGLFYSDPVSSGSFEGEVIVIARPTVHPSCFCGLRTIRRADA